MVLADELQIRGKPTERGGSVWEVGARRVGLRARDLIYQLVRVDR